MMHEIGEEVLPEEMVFDEIYRNDGLDMYCECGNHIDMRGTPIYIIFKGLSVEPDGKVVQLHYPAFPFSCAFCGRTIQMLQVYERNKE